MKKLPLLLVALFCFGGTGLVTVTARPAEVIVENGRPVKYRARKVYIIENHRPVRREVFVDDGGRYFQIREGRRVFIERHYDDYPEKYFYRDGRQREGIKIVF